ncbi:unnamed protein product [Euphydryas editha]|uniref:Uncharacterized protein n=1 Tax=Euphydryas editha TaxID=104508 RepID=A0AAU9TKL8_EUPED|nr:unnamed protein product [Euphydryas editha]
MSDRCRIVYPDELEQMKTKVAAEKATKTMNSVEELPEANKLCNRNMITVPPNCLPGQTLDADGYCRDIF